MTLSDFFFFFFNARGTSLHLCVNTAVTPPVSSIALQLGLCKSDDGAEVSHKHGMTRNEPILWGPLEPSLMTGTTVTLH